MSVAFCIASIKESKSRIVSLLCPFSYHKSSYFRPGHFTEYRVIESLLRISTKYLVQSLRSELIEHLKAYYPSTLEEFRDGYTKHYSLFNHKAPYHSLLAVNMAREFDIPIILPAALYYCCEPPYNKIADGIEDSDGDLVKLCHSDQLLCLTAQRYISSDKLTILNEFLLSQEPSEDCIDPDGCRREMATILADLSAEITDITVFSASPPSTEYDPRLCGSCQEDWSSREMVGYYKMWIELPARFGLPSWNELATLADETVSSFSSRYISVLSPDTQ